MCTQEYYLPLPIRPAGEYHCHKTCRSLYSIDEHESNGGARMYFCTFCEHARIEVTATGELVRLDYCRQHTTLRA